MNKLKERWGIESNWAVVAIFVVFAINGSFAAWVAKPITAFLGLSPDTISGWFYYPLRILLIFPTYQLTLPVVGFLFNFLFLYLLHFRLFALVASPFHQFQNHFRIL